MEERIKYTIKYFLKDGLLGCFVKSIVLNDRLDRICRELESLGFRSNVFGGIDIGGTDITRNNTRVNALLPSGKGGRARGRRKREGRVTCSVKNRDDRCHDLTVEVDLGSMKASAPPTYRCYRRRACKRAATYDSPSNEKIDPTERMESRWNREDSQDTFRSNKARTDFSEGCITEEEERRLLLSSSPSLYSMQRDPSDKDEGKIKRPTLRLIIRKPSTWNCSCMVSLKPTKCARLSLPCVAGQMTKEIFKADPSLRESCLIVMRRKFETGIYNLCSCLNNVLDKLEERIIPNLRLILEIRPGYINFKLIGKTDRESRSCFFTDRVPICQSVHKRDVGSTVENSIDTNEASSSFNEFFNSFNDDVASRDSKKVKEGDYKKIWVSFFSPCSDGSSNEAELTLDERKIDMKKEEIEEKETRLLLDFLVTERSEIKEKPSNSKLIDDDSSMRKENEDRKIVNFDLENGCISNENDIENGCICNEKDIENDCTCNEKDDNNLMECQTTEKVLDVDEEIKLDCTIEFVCCSSCGIPILPTDIDEETNISKDTEYLVNYIKDMLEEIFQNTDLPTIEDTCPCCSLKNEDPSNSTEEKEEKSLNDECSMSLDSLITKKTFNQEEINSDCDSRCSCRTKDPSSSSLVKKTNEDLSPCCELKLKDEVPCSMGNQIEEIEVSRAGNYAEIRLVYIPKYETVSPIMTRNDGKMVQERKDFVSSSIQTSEMRISPRDTNVPTIRRNTTTALPDSWLTEKWSRDLKDVERRRKECERERKEGWKVREEGTSKKKSLEIIRERNRKVSSLPIGRRSTCTCDFSKYSDPRGRKRFKNDSWTSRIKNYVSFRPSNFVFSDSFCESFHSSKKSIGKLRNLVRAKFRRLLSMDGRREVHRSRRKYPDCKKSDGRGRSDIFHDPYGKYDDPCETVRTIYRRGRGKNERIVRNDSNDCFSKRTHGSLSFPRNKTRKRDKDFTWNVRSYRDRDRYLRKGGSTRRRNGRSSMCEDDFDSVSSNGRRSVRPGGDSVKIGIKSTNSEMTFEFELDRNFQDERTKRSSTIDEYERSICNLGLNFRYKLEQYVTLCKNIKYSLIGRVTNK